MILTPKGFQISGAWDSRSAGGLLAAAPPGSANAVARRLMRTTSRRRSKTRFLSQGRSAGPRSWSDGWPIQCANRARSQLRGPGLPPALLFFEAGSYTLNRADLHELWGGKSRSVPPLWLLRQRARRAAAAPGGQEDGLDRLLRPRRLDQPGRKARPGGGPRGSRSLLRRDEGRARGARR